jgi:DNA processing protein
MTPTLSPNTRAMLLLTAPLIGGRGEASPDLLSPGEYRRVAYHLHEMQRQPSDLLFPEADELLRGCQPVIEESRLKRLLARGFLLSQAVERWQTRAIWVVSRADAEYPRRLKACLKNDTPPVLYGCSDSALLDAGGLAVVGSRHVDAALIDFTQDIGRRTAQARLTLVSGGARGSDQAAMHGALEAGGKVAGVLADSLERVVLNREHRNPLLEGQLVLVSPYDPSAGFNVGHAMQRNKLIYALADAALVVSSDYQKGGTWAGAVEQLEKLRLVPVYVRSNGETGKGLEALRRKGALPWPNPETSEALAQALAVEVSPKKDTPGQGGLSLSVREESIQTHEITPSSLPGDDSIGPQSSDSSLTPADDLFAKVRELLTQMTTPKTDAQVATDLHVTKSQAKEWLKRLVDEGMLEKLSKPVCYRSVSSQASLFERLD